MHEKFMRLIELHAADITLDEGEPSLVAAVRYQGRVHPGLQGQTHWDVGKALGIAGPEWKYRDDVQTGFVSHKGHFLTRQRALAYAIQHDLVHQHALRYLATPDAPDELGATFLKK
jgi:hypothetical protein